MYKSLYEYYWLRPENALWRARDLQMMKNVKIVSPSLDFGAGDGALSFIRAGGQLSLEYDAFTEIKNTKNFFSGKDIFDQTKPESLIKLIKQPNYKIDVAFDHKSNLLSKARKLNFYKKTILGDGNLKLPFEDETFKTIFSNIIYWLNDPKKVLEELHRISKINGKLILFLPSLNSKNYSFYFKNYLNNKRPEKFKFLEDIDRGRISKTLNRSKSFDDWKKIILQAGFEIEIFKKYISGSLTRIWDIGLRPFSPFTIEMANSLDISKRLEIKKRWVNETYNLFEGFLNIQEELEKKEPPSFIFFILKKKY